jgi:hypothetical protein
MRGSSFRNAQATLVMLGILALVTTACAGLDRTISAPPVAPTPSTTTPAAEPVRPLGAGTWQLLPPAPIPSGFYATTWTGAELLVHAPVTQDVEHPRGSIDAAYNPSTHTWRRLPGSPYEVRIVEGGSRIVWTGTEMLAFGMMDGALNLTTGRWRPLAMGEAGPSVYAWTGEQVLVWGGGCCGQFLSSGLAYDVARNVWQPLPAAPLAGRHTTGVWTGQELVIIGGQGEQGPFSDGAAYNPRTRTWRKLPPIPVPLTGHTITWTGTEILLVGGTRGDGNPPVPTSKAMAYNPATNTWRPLADMPINRTRHVAVWTGHHLLVWGGVSAYLNNGSNQAPPNGVAYDPVTDHWAAMPPSPLRNRTGATAVWTGTEMLIWGGSGVNPATDYFDGATFRPTDSLPTEAD